MAWLDDYTAGGGEVKPRLVATQVAFGNTDDCLCGYSPAEGCALGGQLGGIKRRETRVLRRRGGVCAGPDR